jgi:hypothetical protein
MFSQPALLTKTHSVAGFVASRLYLETMASQMTFQPSAAGSVFEDVLLSIQYRETARFFHIPLFREVRLLSSLPRRAKAPLLWPLAPFDFSQD